MKSEVFMLVGTMLGAVSLLVSIGLGLFYKAKRDEEKKAHERDQDRLAHG